MTARVSTDDQNLDLQRAALSEAGCERVFEDKASGATADRPGLREAKAFARPGDVLVVWRLDRLGRSVPDLLSLVEELKASGVGFQSLTENLETESSGGVLIFQIFAALAEFERRLIVERTNAGLRAARARGRVGGRPGLSEAKVKSIASAVKANQSPHEVCKALGISRSTYYKYAAQVGQ